MAGSTGTRRGGGRPADGRRLPYWIGYGLMAGTLLGVTGALVLIVLPARYALVADLRESGVSFPTSTEGIAFPVPRREPLIEPPPPPAAPVEREPTAAETLWASVDSLLVAREFDAAIARMDAYLEEHPDDLSVHRERARTLAVAGRAAAARAAFEDLVRQTGSAADRLALARLLRDAGEVSASVALYRDLIAARPDDLELRHELARLYMWSERYAEAEAELEYLVAAAPDVSRYRLDLARVIYWNDRPADARSVLAAMPDDAPEAAEAATLDRELARLLTPPTQPEPVPPTLVEQAREAAAEEDFATAAALYERAVADAPGDSALARERADFLQYRLGDLDAAVAALEAYDTRFGLDADGRYRLAELYVWTGREDAARRQLEALVRDHPERADAWGLLGDVYRYADERGAARDAYVRAMALEPAEPHAAAGLPELDRLRRAAITAREPAGYGPRFSLFNDSDDFLRLDLGAGAGWLGPDFAVDLTTGWRRLEGRSIAGLTGHDQGGFATLEAAKWWSEASLRTALRLGIDHLDAGGTEPVLGASVARFGRSGSTVSLSYDHGPGYLLTSTLESAEAEIAADHVEVATYAPLGDAWSLSGQADLARLSGSEPANTRWSGGLTLARRLGSRLTVDAGTRLLGFTDPAPAPGRRLYWDPELFWANTVGLTIGHPAQRGLGYRFRLSGGAAWADERDAIDSAEWIPQFGAEVGLSWRSERTVLDAATFYRRSREDEYSSFGAELTLRVRP